MAFLEYLIYPASKPAPMEHITFHSLSQIASLAAFSVENTHWKNGMARPQTKEKKIMFQSRTKYGQFTYRGVLSLSLNKCHSNMLTTGFDKQIWVLFIWGPTRNDNVQQATRCPFCLLCKSTAFSGPGQELWTRAIWVTDPCASTNNPFENWSAPSRTPRVCNSCMIIFPVLPREVHHICIFKQRIETLPQVY